MIIDYILYKHQSYSWLLEFIFSVVGSEPVSWGSLPTHCAKNNSNRRIETELVTIHAGTDATVHICLAVGPTQNIWHRNQTWTVASASTLTDCVSMRRLRFIFGTVYNQTNSLDVWCTKNNYFENGVIFSMFTLGLLLQCSVQCTTSCSWTKQILYLYHLLSNNNHSGSFFAGLGIRSFDFRANRLFLSKN